MVESRRSAVAYRIGGAYCERRLSLPFSPSDPSLRFSSPLIEPDVTISVIRLSDGFHVEAFAAPSLGRRSRERTPSFPKTSCSGNWRYPGPANLCRRRRKRRTVWYRC